MNAHEILKKARELISDPKNWIQGNNAQTCHGKLVHPKEEEACNFCANGAILRFFNVDLDKLPLLKECPFNALVRSIWTISGNQSNSISSFNDSCTHDRILAAFDLAIKNTKPKKKGTKK